MLKLVALALVGVIVLAACARSAATLREHKRETPRSDGTVRISADLTVEQLAPNVWMHTSWQELSSGVRFPANGLLVREPTGFVLVDTAWGADVTEQLVDWVENSFGQSVTAAIAGHFHSDALGGARVLTARDIPVATTAQTARLAGEDLPAASNVIGNPDSGESVTVSTLEVFYPGAGHSADNVVVWIESAKILFGGCLVKSAEAQTMGNTADADLVQWPSTLDRVAARYPQAQLLVPGHGRPGASEKLLSHTKGLLKAHRSQE